jgi:hypothetical protein
MARSPNVLPLLGCACKNGTLDIKSGVHINRQSRPVNQPAAAADRRLRFVLIPVQIIVGLRAIEGA